jgi:predicted  nucleic acid-binding Zn-ribbon protein
MSVVKRIFELQQVEISLASLEKRLADVNAHLSYNERYEKTGDLYKAARQKLEEMERQYKRSEAEAEELRKTISSVEDKLYGGKVKNPKELMGYEQELEGLKKKLNKMDDGILAMMEQIESEKSNVARLNSAFKEAEETWLKEKEELQRQSDEIKNEIYQKGVRRSEILASIDAASLAVYEDVKRHRGQAVVRVEQGRCMGCRVTLSLSELQRVRGNSIVRCSNCGRILFLS